VIEVERALLELATSPEDVVEGLLRIARVAEDRLGRPEEAVAAYVEALERSPSCAPGLAGLEHLLRKAPDYRTFGKILGRFAELAPNPEDKIRTLMHAASIQELACGDIDGAFASYDKVVRLVEEYAIGCSRGDPSNAIESAYSAYAALAGLARLHEV